MLLNFPSHADDKIYRRHFKVQNLSGVYKLLYFEQLPRICFVIGGNQNEFIDYFLNKRLFTNPPKWIFLRNNLIEKAFKYEYGKYKLFSNNVDWNEIKYSPPIEITKSCAKKIVEKIYEENESWLNNEKSKRAVQAIPRIFAEPTVLIYELIQNAFDADATKVKIELDRENLRFYHNGNNFTESDVNSISFVNLSNKERDKVGFMGIGFKSVFEASNKPEIHSYPFSFLFDNAVEGGYILPGYVKIKPIKENFSTLFSIPLKNQNIYEMTNSGLIPEEKIDSGMGFSRKTFLHLLKKKKDKFIGITDVKTPHINFRILRDNNPNMYHIRDISNAKELRTESWLRFEKRFRPDREQIEEFLESRNIKDRELLEKGWEEIVSILIPLTRQGSKYSPLIDYSGLLNVYLPTKIKTHMNFDIQGNFIVTASRENLKYKHGKWNRGLFDNLSHLIVNIFEWCKSINDSNSIDIPAFYALIPEWEMIEKQEHISPDIVESIKSDFIETFNSKPLIPVETKGSKRVNYKYPHECIIVDNTLLELFGKGTLEGASRKKVVLSDFDEGVRQKILNSSDVSKWDIEDTIELLSRDKWKEHIPKFKNQRGFNRWLSKLYSYLYEHFPSYSYDYSGLPERILGCYIYPIQWLGEEKVYRFTRYQFRKKILYRFPREQAKIHLQAFKNKINVLDQSFENYLQGRTGRLSEDEKKTLENSRVFLKKIGIQILEPVTIIKDFIIPLFNNVSDYDDDTLISYTSFICNHLSEIKRSNVDINIPLLNKKGEFCEPTNLFFGEDYGFLDIIFFFGNSHDELIISNQYLENTSSNTDQWVDMFSYIGVNSYLPCKIIKDKLYPSELREKLGEEIDLPRPRVTYLNKDFPGEKYLLLDYGFSDKVRVRLEEINVLPLKAKKDSMRAFLKILDKYWNEKYSKNIHVKIKYYKEREWGYGSPHEKILDNFSSFSEYLLNENWVPAINTDELKNPREVVKLTDENISLSDEGVILCEEKIGNKDLLKFLSFKPVPEEITNLHRLVNLKSREIKNLEKYREIYSLIYHDIQNNTVNVEEVKREFTNNKLIYANNKFFSPEEIIYSPPTQLQLYLPKLDDFYPELEGFFCYILGCPKDQPSIEHILRYFLNFVWQSDRGMSDEYRATILYGYRKILDFITDNELLNLLQIPLWQEFVNNAKIFCKNTRWVEIDADKPILYLDTVKYERNFVSCDKIYVESHLRQLKKDTEDLLRLLDLFKIKSVSRNTDERIEPWGEKEIYHNTNVIETNIGLLINKITEVLDSKEKDITSKEKGQLNRFTEIVKDFMSKRIMVYRVSQIKSIIYLDKTEELFSISKSCHINNISGLLEIFVTDDIRTVYGAFKDELISELHTDILSLQSRELVQNMVINTIANIEDNFAESIDRFLAENGLKIEIIHEKKMKDDVEEPQYKNEPKDVYGETRPSEAPKSYEEITKGITDFGDIELRTIDEIDVSQRDDDGEKANKKSKKRTSRGRSPPYNPFSEEDGKRGEEIAFNREIIRLRKIGLNEYTPYHISKDIRGHPWDIESFDIQDGKVVPIRIEVKSTPQSDNHVFHMSESQFNVALDEKHTKGRYYIYRVFNVRTEKPDIERFDFYKMHSKKLITFRVKDFYMEILTRS